jgi:hypothetical protein
MEQAITWVIENYDTVALIVGGIAALDGVAGLIPNRILPYIGLIRRLLLRVVRK